MTEGVLWLLLTVPLVALQCVIVAFTDHTHLHFNGSICLIFVVLGLFSICNRFTKFQENDLNSYKIRIILKFKISQEIQIEFQAI